MYACKECLCVDLLEYLGLATVLSYYYLLMRLGHVHFVEFAGV